MTPTVEPADPTPPADEGPGPRRRRRWGWWAAWALTAVASAVTLAVTLEPLVAILVLFVLVVPFEKLFPRHRQPLRRPLLGTDLAHAVLAGPLGAVGLFVGVIVGVASLAWLPGLALRPLVELVPTVPRAVAGILLFDLATYWTHRLFHEVPFLWRFHRIHHSTQHLDWISGFRLHPLDGALAAPAFALLLGAGFTAEYGGALVAVQIISGLFLHANVRWRLRPLHKLIITPEFHHWHHELDPAAHHTNYSVFLPLWDLVFGTYRMPADARPQRYGVVDPVSPTVVGQLWEPFRGLRSPVPFLRHLLRHRAELAAMARRGARQVVAATRRRRPADVVGAPS